MTTKTREAKPKWCSPCKKTRRGITTDEGFRCNQCAEEMGFTIKKRKGQGGAGRFASPMGHLFGVGRSAADSRAAQLNAADSKMRRRAAAKKAAATRRRKAAQAARKAMFDGMQPMNAMLVRFIPADAYAVCRGCKTIQRDFNQVSWVMRDSTPMKCVCDTCTKEANA